MSRGKSKKSGKEQAPQKKSKIQETHEVDALSDIANKLRISAVEMTKAAGSGHPTSCASIAEIMAVLFFDKSGMHYDCKNPKESFTSDRFVLSKGHAAPILYAAWAENGFIQKEELLNLRKITSDLEGHPTPKLPFVDVASGSLGQGLSVACGMAYSSKYFDKIDNRYWVVVGDGECAEGSIWEAANFASKYKLNNITLMVDVNRLGQSQETALGHDGKIYQKRFESFGWQVISVDGHNIESIIKAFDKARDSSDKPTALVCLTYKGRGFPEIEDQLDWHGKAITGDKFETCIKSLKESIKDENKKLEPTKPEIEEYKQSQVPDKLVMGELPYKKGEKKISTRFAYGQALKRIGASDINKKIVVLDGDTKNSTYSIEFLKSFPNNFVECYISEQNMIGVASGLSCRKKIPFVSTFGAFFSRAYDQIRIAGISNLDFTLCGSHCGVSIGEDGPSQMALEDLAMMKALPNSVVFYPSDAVSCERAVELAANIKGIKYIRTNRPDSDILYGNDEKFEVGKCKIVNQSSSDKVLVVSSGITLHEALKAAKTLQGQGVNIKVIDLFCIKPIDKDELIKSAKSSNNLVLTVEEHYPCGGIHDSVCSALAQEAGIKVFQLAVDKVPRSGKQQELLDIFNISDKAIVEKVNMILKN